MDEQKKSTILVVEDDAPSALALGDKLTQEGFNVVKAENGEEGLKQALSTHPDLILADLIMPKMGGMDMIRELRKDAWGKTAKVIILTNVTDVETVEQAMKEEAFFYMVKGDSTPAEIVAKVRARLSGM